MDVITVAQELMKFRTETGNREQDYERLTFYGETGRSDRWYNNSDHRPEVTYGKSKNGGAD